MTSFILTSAKPFLITSVDRSVTNDFYTSIKGTSIYFWKMSAMVIAIEYALDRSPPPPPPPRGCRAPKLLIFLLFWPCWGNMVLRRISKGNWSLKPKSLNLVASPRVAAWVNTSLRCDMIFWNETVDAAVAKRASVQPFCFFTRVLFCVHLAQCRFFEMQKVAKFFITSAE